MIVVHVNQTWPRVQADAMTPEEAVLGRWPITQDKLDEFGDAVAGVYDNLVVAVYDVTGYSRDEENKVTFEGTPSRRWAHLVDQPTPATPWGRQGDAWPVRTVDSAVVAGGDVSIKLTQSGRRAVVGGFTVTIGADGNATVLAPIDRTVTIRPVLYPAEWVTDGLPPLGDVDDLAARDAYLHDGHADVVGPNAPRQSSPPTS